MHAATMPGAAIKPSGETGFFETGRPWTGGDLAAEFHSGMKKQRYAYPAWLCLGSHYLYLSRPMVQLLFWLTAGGLLLWWLIDFCRLGSMVARHNRQRLEKLAGRYELALHQRLLELEEEVGNRPRPHPVFMESEPQRFADEPEPELDHDVAPVAPASRRRTRRTGPALVIMGALAVAVALYVFNPPPLFPRAVVGAPYRTLRQVNVRALPSTSSPIRAVVEQGAVLQGTVETAASSGATRWLRINRGSNAGSYVAMQNLDAE